MSAAPKMEPDFKKFAVTSSTQTHLPPAPKGSRLIAAFLDGFFSAALVGVGAAVIKVAFKNDVLTQLSWQLIWPLIYNALPVYTTGQTLGKKLMKIQIVHEDPNEEVSLMTAIRRELVYKFFSFLVFGLGLFRILTHPDGQSWHDGWTKTRVVSVKEE